MRKDTIAIVGGLLGTIIVGVLIIYSIQFLSGIISDARSGDTITPPSVQEFNLEEARALELDEVAPLQVNIGTILDNVTSISSGQATSTATSTETLD